METAPKAETGKPEAIAKRDKTEIKNPEHEGHKEDKNVATEVTTEKEAAPLPPQEKASGKADGAEIKTQPTTTTTSAASNNPPVEHDTSTVTAHAENTPDSGKEPLKITARRDEWGVTLNFPWHERTATAVFLRGKYLWIVFNKKKKLDVSSLTQPPASTYIDEVRQMNVKGHSVLHITTRGTTDAIVKKTSGKEIWTVTLTAEPLIPASPIQVQHNTAPPLRPHFFLPVLQISEPVKLKDPLIGDQLLVIPLYKPGEAVSRTRKTVEFNLLKTAQGIAVEPLSDELRTVMLRNGIKLSVPGGLQLSSDQPAVANDKPDRSVSGGKTFFPYDEWKTEDGTAFFERKNELLLEAGTGNDQQKMKARLDLAKLYLGEGLASEALGILDTIKSDDLNFYLGARAAALHGAANFLLLRLGEASRDFSSVELDGLKETELWRGIMDTVFGRKDGGFDYLGYDKNYISKYPPLIRQKLALIAADRYIARQQFNKAIKIFEGLNKDNILKPISDEVDYMIGQISEQTGQIANAIQLWEKLARVDNPNRSVRARAEFSLVNLMLKENEISLEDAISRLDRLRIVWRGDGLEIALLEQLGNLYQQNGDFINSLRAYRELVTYFPHLPNRLEITQHMAQMFVHLFNEGGADDMQPLDALSLYYEFRELTPIGEEGDKMIRNLADRLAAVDLLDRAAALLQHQVRFRLAGEERSRVGARLAVLHLLNRQPEKALDVLKVTGYGRNPDELDQERRLLAARALADMKKFDRALQIIEDDFTPQALALKQELLWETKNWTDLIALAEETMGNREDPTKPLSKEETETLLRLAVAYMFQREYSQLRYLKDYFTPLLPEEGPERDMFAYVTGDSGPVDHENLANLTRDIANIQSFISKYRERIEQAGLSSVAQ